MSILAISQEAVWLRQCADNYDEAAQLLQDRVDTMCADASKAVQRAVDGCAQVLGVCSDAANLVLNDTLARAVQLFRVVDDRAFEAEVDAERLSLAPSVGGQVLLDTAAWTLLDAPATCVPWLQPVQTQDGIAFALSMTYSVLRVAKRKNPFPDMSYYTRAEWATLC